MATLSERLTEQLVRAQSRLELYLTAEQAILAGAQAYSIGNRTLSRADLSSISKMISKLQDEIIRLERGGSIRVQRVVVRDL